MRLKKCIRFLSILLIVLFSACRAKTGETSENKNPNGRSDAWEHVGIGGGGSMFFPTISPHDPDVVFLCCDMTGSYVTYDGGESWRMFNLPRKTFRTTFPFFVFDPVDPDVVYANATGLFKSTDKGKTWSLFYPKPSEITGRVSKGDHAVERLVTKDSTIRTVQTLVIDPSQSKKMYAAIRIDQSVGFYVSDDGGMDWRKEKELQGDVRAIFIDPSSPAKQRTVYVAMENGIEKWEDGKWQTNEIADKTIKFNSFSGGYHEAEKKYILYAVSGQGYHSNEQTTSGIYYSEDGGKTWESRQNGILGFFAQHSGVPE